MKISLLRYQIRNVIQPSWDKQNFTCMNGDLFSFVSCDFLLTGKENGYDMIGNISLSVINRLRQFFFKNAGISITQKGFYFSGIEKALGNEDHFSR